MRQTALTETADGTGTDAVVRIESGRVLYAYYFGADTSTSGASTPAVAWNTTLQGGAGASGLVAAGLALAATASLMAF